MSTIDALRDKFSHPDERERCALHGEPVVKNTNGSCVECFREALERAKKLQAAKDRAAAEGTWEAEPVRDVTGVLIEESSLLHEVDVPDTSPWRPEKTVCGVYLNGKGHRLMPSTSDQIGCWRCKRRIGKGVAGALLDAAKKP